MPLPFALGLGLLGVGGQYLWDKYRDSRYANTADAVQGLLGSSTQGTGLFGGELGPEQFYGRLLTTPGYEDVGAQGLLSMTTPGKPQGPTTLERQLVAAGYAPGTPEFFEAMNKAIFKPSTEINLRTGPDLPTNYQWRVPGDPSQGVIPIPGGPDDPGIKHQKSYRDAMDKIGRVESSLDQYEGLIKKHGAEVLPGPAKTQLQSSYNDLLLEMKELYNLGAITGPDYSIMQQVLRDPTSASAKSMEVVGGGRALTGQLDLVRKKLEAARQRAAQIYGNKPAQPAQAPKSDPLGIRR